MNTATNTIESGADILDVRDIIARVEYLRDDLAEDADADEKAELAGLLAFLGELEGNGGDEQWEGAWYPVALISDSYFKEYAQELAEDCGMISNNAKWPCTCIDWERAVRELQMDYTSADFGGVTYWFR